MCSKLFIYSARILCLFLFVSNSWCAAPIFQLLNTYSAGGYSPTSVALADVNGDGNLDVIVANRCATSDTCPNGGTVGVLLGNGDGSLQPVVTYNSGGSYASFVTVGDLNGDGKPDLIVANSSMAQFRPVGGIGILFGNGDGTFQPAVSYAADGNPIYGVAVADFNHDGIADVAIANSQTPNYYYLGTVSVLLGTGGGKFQAAQIYSSGYWTNSVVAADVNGDGAADLLVGDSSSVSVLLGVGDGTFQPATAYPSAGNEGCCIAVADVNGDGKLDLVAVNPFGPNRVNGYSTVGVLLGNGDGSFQPVTRYWTSTYAATSMVVADFNRDHKVDILVTGDKLVVFWGQGDGTFLRAPGMPFYRGAIAVGDMDGDTRPDVVQVVNDQVNVLRNVIPFSTTTELRSNQNPTVYGKAVTLRATVVSDGPFAPTGTVVFKNGDAGIGNARIVGGMAALTKTNLPSGSLSITAVYQDDIDSAKSTSTPLTQVIKMASSNTTIQSSANPSVQGQPVKFTATMTSPTAKITGTVTFTAGTTTLGTVTVNWGGQASFSTSALPPGTSTITATYEGTPNIRASAVSLTQTVK